MATANKAYRYSVEMDVHVVDAPGTRMTTKGDIYMNICLLGVHKRTRLMPPHLPMHIDQKLYFDKVGMLSSITQRTENRSCRSSNRVMILETSSND
jgi:hypothetical protein